MLFSRPKALVAKEPVKPAFVSSNGKSSVPPSILSRDLRVIGNLSSAGDMQVDGIVEGDVKSRTLTLGETGAVTGTVEAEQARICGSIRGKLVARSVELSRTAKIFGDIIHQTLSIEAGAKVEGMLSRMDEEAKAIAPPKTEFRVSDAVTMEKSDQVSADITRFPATGEQPLAMETNGARAYLKSNQVKDDVVSTTADLDDVPNPLKNKIRGALS